jgi:hypothetical protein
MLWRKSTLWTASLTALALGTLGTGCVIDGDDETAVQAEWDVAYAVGTGAQAPRITCADAGTEWVRLELKSRKNVGSFSFDFPCASGAGLTDKVPAGSYDVVMSLLDARMRPVAATPLAVEVRRSGRTVLPLVQFQVLAWQVSWVFTLKQAGMPDKIASCQEVGAKTVELVTQLGSEEQERYPFDCSVGLGLTHAVRAGSYGFQIRVLDAAGQPIKATMPQGKLLTDRFAIVEAPFTVP